MLLASNHAVGWLDQQNQEKYSVGGKRLATLIEPIAPTLFPKESSSRDYEEQMNTTTRIKLSSGLL
jgi:hypothetical protein